MSDSDTPATPEPMVLVIVTGFEAYQMALLRGMQLELSQCGVPLLAFSNHVGSCEDASVDSGMVIPPSLACLLTHHRLKGVILANALSEEQSRILHETLTTQDIPTVYLAQAVSGQACVCADNEGGMRELMAHLLDECGVRVAAMIRGFAHHIDHVTRELVFRRELERRGLPVCEELFADGKGEREVARNGMREILARRRDIEAVVTTDDWCASAVMVTLTEAGLSVPNDVVVTGFDNYPIALMSWPGITTVDQDLELQGRLAARSLIQLAAGSSQRELLLTPCRLITRGSTLNPRRAAAKLEGNAELSDSRDHVVDNERIACLAQAHMAEHNAIRRTSRELSECRSLEDIREAIASCLPLLGIRRCFVVIYVQDNCAPDTMHRTAQLILDFRNGASHAVPEGAFSSCSLLPECLAGELNQGFLGLQLLTATSGVLGYLLTDHPPAYVATAENLKRDLGHSLEAIFSTEALKAHSEMLEDLVRRRTVELEDEIVTRKRAEQDLQRALQTDALTQIANRRAFQAKFDEQWRLHMETSCELALLMVDVDLFKHYNDHYGHLKGDRALREVAACLRRAARYPGDLASRFGGEEFTLLLAKTDREGALIVGQRFRELLANAAIPHAASSVAPIVTASIGVAVITPTETTSPDVLLAAADQALYTAKEQGRNRIVLGSVSELRGSLSLRSPRSVRGSTSP